MSRVFSYSLLLTSSLLGLLAFGAFAGQKPKPDDILVEIKGNGKTETTARFVDFHTEIEPLLNSACSRCHSVNKREGGFIVTPVTALFKGGKQYGEKIIVPGKASESALIAYLRGKIKPLMPLGSDPFSEAQIKKIEQWINEGAKADAGDAGWLYRRPQKVSVPKVKNAAWVQNPIDAFVLAKLEERGLKPSLPAEKTALMRRVYMDLVGVPPTLKQQAAFLNNPAPDAYERMIDTLLEDPLYGERWGRHWLDLVRYADTDGDDDDRVRPRAWRYRDYVIRAFNDDKPYDRFLKEQLAGDELFPGDADAMIATGFLRLGPGEEMKQNDDRRRHEFLNDATDTTASVVLGVTIGCARCHDHKYDRFKQSDYYRLQAFFAPAQWSTVRLSNLRDPVDLRKRYETVRAKYEPLKRGLDRLYDKHTVLVLAERQKDAKKRKRTEVSRNEINDSINKDEEDRKLRDRLEEAMKPYETTAVGLTPEADVVLDAAGEIPRTFILKRGERYQQEREVRAGFPAALNDGQENAATVTARRGGSGRRAALAEWIGSKDNPLTARVLVNRLWQKHFGRGLVATPSDLGANGEYGGKPSHPELLDWLALTFVSPQAKRSNGIGSPPEGDGSWSLKKMHRLILISNTYRQAAVSHPQGLAIDPANRLLWRMNRFRVEGEVLRDSILAVSGRLDYTTGGPGVYPKLSEEFLEDNKKEKWGESSAADRLRRSVYIFQRRSMPMPFLDNFDGPDMANTCSRRTQTTTVPQALALFNGEFARTEAGFFARRLAALAPGNWDKQIDFACQLAFCRPATKAQIVRAKRFIQAQGKRFIGDDTSAGPETRADAAMDALVDFCHVLLNSSEFLYLD